MTTRHYPAALAMFGALIAAPAAHAQSASQDQKEGASNRSTASVRLSTGISYSKGDYGDIAATKVLAVPVSLTYRNGPLKLRVSVPWVRVDGPGSLIVTPTGRDAGGGGGDVGGGDRSSNSGPGSSNSGSGSSGSGGSGSSGSGSGGSGTSGSGSSGTTIVDPGGAVAGNRRRSGIGDVNLSGVYSIALGGDFFAEPGLKLKLPTASRAKRLGTGKVDVTTSLDLVKDIGAASLYVHGRRKFAGKPAGSTLRSTWGAGAGASVRASDTVSVGADYDWQQSPFAGRKASSEASGWANVRFNRRLNMTVYAGTGLNSNSADFLGGASLSYRF